MVSHRIIPSVQLRIVLTDCHNRVSWVVSRCSWNREK